MILLLLLVVAVLAGVVVWLTGQLRSARAERDAADARLAEAADGAEELRVQLTELEAQLQTQALASQRLVTSDRAPVIVDDREFVITDLARERALVPGIPSVPLPFVDTLLRESLVRTASLAAGLRHALAPEVRNRIRFEMKREVKRSRKQRRTDLRQARREFEARQRAGIELTG
ncbi:MAG TPA: hypothetical protein VN088_18020 [Nocardioides sp.]|nr:hypothetical protein [Nocardioides sp.]